MSRWSSTDTSLFYILLLRMSSCLMGHILSDCRPINKAGILVSVFFLLQTVWFITMAFNSSTLVYINAYVFACKLQSLYSPTFVLLYQCSLDFFISKNKIFIKIPHIQPQVGSHFESAISQHRFVLMIQPQGLILGKMVRK